MSNNSAIINNADRTLSNYKCADYPKGYPQLRKRLKTKYKTKRFKYGDSNFLPKQNGNPNTPLHDIMNEISQEISGKNAVPIPYEWKNFYDDFKSKSFQTIVDPIISTRRRPSFIIPYAFLTSCIMIVDEDIIGPSFREYYIEIEEIRKSIKEFNPYYPPESIKLALQELNNHTNGFAVRSGFIEEDILLIAFIEPSRTMRLNETLHNFVKNSIKNRQVVILDSHSVETLKLELGEKIEKFTIKSLFGSLVYSLAGFPIRIDDRDLMFFFEAHFKCKDGIIHKKLDSISHTYQQKCLKYGIDLSTPRLIDYSNVSIPISISPSSCNGFSKKLLNGSFNKRLLNPPPELPGANILKRTEIPGYVDSIDEENAIIKINYKGREEFRRMNIDKLSSKGADYVGACINIIISELITGELITQIVYDENREDEIRKKALESKTTYRDKLILEYLKEKRKK